jgi:hypothetical protein
MNTLSKVMPLSLEKMVISGATVLLFMIFANKSTSVFISWTVLVLWTVFVLFLNILDLFTPDKPKNEWMFVCCRLLTTCIFAVIFGGLIILISRS